MLFRVMIVDDSATNRLLLDAMVKRLDQVETYLFASASEAMDWAVVNEPDLVFVDFLMPGMDGVEFIHRLRQMPHCEAVPIVMVTGFEDKRTLYRALEAGATDFLNKPPDEVEFLARTRNMLKIRGSRRELIRLATIDDLTGLFNRRYFMRRLAEEISHAHADYQLLSLVALDVDHFKRINDRQGHATGDRALERLGEICRFTMRSSDIIGRIGGEELAVIMPLASRVEAAICCERLRTTIEECVITNDDGERVPMTVSVGLTEIWTGDDARKLLSRADQALYAAKRAGRNRVMVFRENGTIEALADNQHWLSYRRQLKQALG